MASIFKPTYTKTDPITGKKTTHKLAKYYIKYRDADGKWQRVPGSKNKDTAKRMAADLEDEADLIRRGVLDATAKHANRSLADLLDEFKEALESKKDTAEHVKLIGYRIQAILDGCDFDFPRDLDGAKVEKWLADQHKAGDMALQTWTHYVRAIKQFAKWLVDHQRIKTDPMRLLKTQNAATDRRHVRRSLDADDFTKLIETTYGQPTIGTLTGPDRAILYLTAAYTGYRASELADLAPEGFILEGNPATVTIHATTSKRRRLDVIPISEDIARQIRRWLEGKQAGQRVWPGTWAKHHHAGQLLKADLEAAKIAHRDESGRVYDFHALRGQFATNLARAGVHPRTAQLLMRHSTIELTMNAYSHLGLVDLEGAVKNLPAAPNAIGAIGKKPATLEKKATGTEGKAQ